MKQERIKRSTLHEQVAARIRTEVLVKLRPGDKLETEAKLAARFDVSRNTVREAITTFVHEGLIERRAGRGTVIRERGDPGQPRVGLWFVLNPWAEYALRVLSRMLVNLAEGGMAVKTYFASELTYESASDPAYRELMDDLTHRRLQAVGFVLGPMRPEARELIRQTQVPAVGGDLDCSTEVTSDFTGMVREGTRYLLEQGCRQIAWLAWFGPGGGTQTGRAMEAFQQTLAGSGASFRKEWVRTDLHPRWPGAGYAEFREVWTGAPEKPDGLLVADDVLLPDVALAIRELGIRVPEQLRVVAHANKGMVTCPSFPAARMEYDPHEEARVMSECLAKAARGEPIEPRRIVLPFQWRGVPQRNAVTAGQ